MVKNNYHPSFRRLLTFIAAVASALSFVAVPYATASTRQTDDLHIPAYLAPHVASPAESKDVLHVAFPSASELDYPSSNHKNVGVEKRDETTFIVYSTENLSDSSARLDIRVVDLNSSSVTKTQQYSFSRNSYNNDYAVEIFDDGQQLWVGDLSESREATKNDEFTNNYVSPNSAYDACIASVDSLCAVGAGAGGAIVCLLLALTVIAGIACGAVLGLISMFGCNGAKQRVCATASRN